MSLPIYISLLGALFFAGPMAGQSGETTVEGTLTDYYTNAPIGSAVVMAVPMGSVGVQRTPPAMAPTDTSGHFSVTLKTPGRYVLMPQAEGYVALSPLDKMPPVVSVGDQQKTETVDIALYRPATVTGKIVGNSGHAPIVGAAVTALVSRYQKGRRTLLPIGTGAVTTGTGSFEISDLPPGEYVLEVLPRNAEEQFVLSRQPDYTDKNPRPEAFLRTFWPVGGSAEGAPAVTLPSGQHIDVGSIELNRQPVYRIRGTIEASNCGQEGITLQLAQRYGGLDISRASSKVPCKSTFTLQNITPGAYRLAAWSRGQTKEVRTSAEQLTTVDREDIETALVLASPIAISGKLIFPERMPEEARTRVLTRLVPLGSLPFADEAPVKVGADGIFNTVLPLRGDVEFVAYGLQAPYFVKWVEYNGSHAESGIFQPSRDALEQKLTVEISDQAATIRGAVSWKDKPVAGASIRLVKWPILLKDGYPVAKTLEADGAGQFSQAGIEPGTYRIIAIRGSMQQDLEKPGVLGSMVTSAKEIVLKEGETQSVSIELTIP